MNRKNIAIIFIVLCLTFAISANFFFAKDDLNLCDQIGAIEMDPDKVASPIKREDYSADQVIAACRDALKSDPRNPRYRFQIGIAFLTQSALEHSSEIHKKGLRQLIIAANHNYTAAAIFLIKNLQTLDETFAARGGRSQTVKTPTSTKYHCDEIGAIGVDTERMGSPVRIEDYKPNEVVAACQTALKEEPDNPRFHFQLAIAMMAEGSHQDYTNGLPHLEAAAKASYKAAIGTISALTIKKFNLTTRHERSGQ